MSSATFLYSFFVKPFSVQLAAFLLLAIILFVSFELLPLFFGSKSSVKKNLPDFLRFQVLRGGIIVLVGAALSSLFFFVGIANGLINISYLPLVLQVLIIYLSSEFCIYWLHRSVHRHVVPLISRAHHFHHSVTTDMEWVNSKKEHYLVLFLFVFVFSFFFFIIFHPSGAARAVALGVYVLLNAFSHLNSHISVAYLDRVFLFPKDHLRHHTKRSGPYGITLSLFDTIFDTRGD